MAIFIIQLSQRDVHIPKQKTKKKPLLKFQGDIMVRRILLKIKCVMGPNNKASITTFPDCKNHLIQSSSSFGATTVNDGATTKCSNTNALSGIMYMYVQRILRPRTNPSNVYDKRLPECHKWHCEL